MPGDEGGGGQWYDKFRVSTLSPDLCGDGTVPVLIEDCESFPESGKFILEVGQISLDVKKYLCSLGTTSI